MVLALKMEKRSCESRHVEASRSWEWPSVDSQQENRKLDSYNHKCKERKSTKTQNEQKKTDLSPIEPLKQQQQQQQQ